MLQSRVFRTTTLIAAFACAALLAFYVVAQQAGTPTITSPQRVYLASDTVALSGTNFAPSDSVDVVVVRPDGTIVQGDGLETPGFDVAATDASGSWSLAYVLNPEATEIFGRYDVTAYATTDTLHQLPLATYHFFDDDSAVPTSISTSLSGLTVTVSGNWLWTQCVHGTNTVQKHVGVAIDWGDGTGVANPAPPPSTSRDGVYPSDVTTWDGCAPPGTGNYGSFSHTYTSGGTRSICVILYDVRFTPPATPAATGNHSTHPWQNKDNSASESDDEQPMCTSTQISTATPTADEDADEHARLPPTATRTNTPVPTNTPTKTPTAADEHADEDADQHAGADQHAHQHAGAADEHFDADEDADEHTGATNRDADEHAGADKHANEHTGAANRDADQHAGAADRDADEHAGADKHADEHAGAADRDADQHTGRRQTRHVRRPTRRCRRRTRRPTPS